MNRIPVTPRAFAALGAGEILLLGYMVWLHRLYETQKARRDLPAAIETGGLLIDARQVLLNEAFVNPRERLESL